MKALLVVVDKLSKRAHFIPLPGDHRAEDTARLFYKEVYKHHGLQRRIISDRDTRFTANFWKELTRLLKIKTNLSTAFYPQTDGQSERSFRVIQEMLRCFVGYTQRDWDKYLPGLEFSYNSHVSDTTHYSPFFLEYGQDSLSVSDILYSDENADNQDTKKFIEEIRDATRLAKHAIEDENIRNADNINTSRQETTFEADDLVLLSTKNLALKPGRNKKLSPKYIGPLRVLKKLAEGRAYKLEMPSELGTLHDTFHISLLKHFVPDESNREIPSTEASRNFMSIQELLNPA